MPWKSWVWGVIVCLLPLVAGAQPPEEPSAEERDERQARFAYIHEQMAAFELRYLDDAQTELKLSSEPVLRYTNPVRSANGIAASYLWLEGNRPVAAGCLSIRQEDKVYRELVSLSPKALQLTKADAALWTPTSQAQPPQPLPDAPIPAPTAPQRLIQMRSLARQFSVKMFRDPPVNARLLPQPIHRYADDELQIHDAGLFAFVETTDPEALLAIEAIARGKDDKPTWHYRFARMTSAGLDVRRGDAQVFTVESYWRNPRAKTDAYQEAQQIRYGAEPPPAE